MIRVGYSINRRIRLALSNLLPENGILGFVETNTPDPIVVEEGGQQALQIHPTFIESNSYLEPEKELILHAALIISGAVHFGHLAVAAWPSKWLWSPQATSAKVVSERLGWRILRQGEFWGVLSLPDSKNAILLIGRALGVRGEFGTFICLNRQGEQRLHEIWNDLVTKLASEGWTEQMRQPTRGMRGI